jgi:hypothetical protein
LGEKGVGGRSVGIDVGSEVIFQRGVPNVLKNSVLSEKLMRYDERMNGVDLRREKRKEVVTKRKKIVIGN